MASAVSVSPFEHTQGAGEAGICLGLFPGELRVGGNGDAQISNRSDLGLYVMLSWTYSAAYSERLGRAKEPTKMTWYDGTCS